MAVSIMAASKPSSNYEPDFCENGIFFPHLGKHIVPGTFMVFSDKSKAYGGKAIDDISHISIGRVLREQGSKHCMLHIFDRSSDSAAKLRGFKPITKTDLVARIEKELLLFEVFAFGMKAFGSFCLGRQGCECFFVVVSSNELYHFPCEHPSRHKLIQSSVKRLYIDFENMVTGINACLNYTGMKAMVAFARNKDCAVTAEGWEWLVRRITARESYDGLFSLRTGDKRQQQAWRKSAGFEFRKIKLEFPNCETLVFTSCFRCLDLWCRLFGLSCLFGSSMGAPSPTINQDTRRKIPCKQFQLREGSMVNFLQVDESVIKDDVFIRFKFNPAKNQMQMKFFAIRRKVVHITGRGDLSDEFQNSLLRSFHGHQFYTALSDFHDGIYPEVLVDGRSDDSEDTFSVSAFEPEVGSDFLFNGVQHVVRSIDDGKVLASVNADGSTAAAPLIELTRTECARLIYDTCCNDPLD